jgi:catechol 2,3-dioxygenase-like lactoylglutathione lyase family enzyme
VTISFQPATPILRIFSLEKAKEFYLDFLGFKIDWEHTFEPGTPVYMQVSRGSLQLHLSEHHGDSVPGSAIFVYMSGIDEFHRELSEKKYRHMRPGIVEQPWQMREMGVIDPFGNRIRFGEKLG